MLFIAAVDKMLRQLDDLFRKKLKLGSLDSSTIIVRKIVSPLLTAEYQEAENKRASDEDQEEIIENEVIDYPLRFVGMNWLAFLALSDEDFKKNMRENLSGVGLDIKKLLILFRLRNNIESATIDAKQKLEARDKPVEKALESKDENVSDKKHNKKGAKKQTESVEGLKSAEALSESALPAIETALLTSILAQIEQAILCVDLAKQLSVTQVTQNITLQEGTGETEVFLQKLKLFLKTYMDFCTEVDTQTSREIGSPYAFRDMLPSVMLRDDFVIKCHLAMHEYMLKNLDDYTQVSVDTEKRGSSIKYLYTRFCNFGYSTDVSVLKRNQVIDFLVALSERTSKKDPASIEYKKATLSCIDTYLLAASTAQNIASSYIKTTKLDAAYSELHESLVSKMPKHSAKDFHSCMASGYVRKA